MYNPKDHYFKKAKAEGYPARSVYKLKEINQQYKIIKPGCRVLELGCSPGSWLKYCSQTVGKQGLVVGIDIKKLDTPLPHNARFIQSDVRQLTAEQLEGLSSAFDAMISDMAPNTTGIKLADEQASLELALEVLSLAQKFLCPKGSLLIKVFEGEDLDLLINPIKKEFNKLHIIRPKAIRKGSRELYVLGVNKKT